MAIASNGLSGLNIGNGDASIAPVQTSQIVETISDEEYIKMRFSHRPILIEVAKCESRFRQTGKDGKVLRGEIVPQDLGIMQVNEFYHGERADKLGFNLETREGNTSYAEYLFDREGLAPWRSSSKCWSKTQVYVDFINNRELAK